MAKMREFSSKLESELDEARKSNKLLKTVEFLKKILLKKFRIASLNVKNLKKNLKKWKKK